MVVAEARSARLRVLIACSGLGHVFRGLETASAELAEALRGQVHVTIARDAFVLPTHQEGFCIVVLEAMDAGIPCVVSDIPVFRWLLGDAGVLVPPDQPEQWAAALRALSPARRRELSERGRRRAADFHWPRVVGDYLAVYPKVLGQESR